MTNIETSSGLTRFYRGWRFFLKKLATILRTRENKDVTNDH